jgi:hypothetical protein
MDGLVVNGMVPVLSVLLGAGLTYWLNVRQRRRSTVENLFDQAIAAVAVADAAQHYLRADFFVQPVAANDDEMRQLRARIELSAIENAAQRAAEARQALARVLQYAPDIRAYYQVADLVIKVPDEIIAQLVTMRDAWLRRR